CDNGIGIEKKNLEKIFSPFKRLHSYNEIKGTGIGLSLCKKIVENIGGSISIHSVVEHGSIFTIIIPKKQDPNTAKKGNIDEKISR
ncbi:MAG: HAMP domain-containing histidine kinase, partial [Lentisphaeraceae bacterium]|nr:HAMP domain-containing histidine kinase [Lentisphaeraceae bacterium]